LKYPSNIGNKKNKILNKQKNNITPTHNTQKRFKLHYSIDEITQKASKKTLLKRNRRITTHNTQINSSILTTIQEKNT